MPVIDGVGVVTTAGTAVRVASVPTLVDTFTIFPNASNVGAIWVGKPGSIAANRGAKLGVGDSWTAPPVYRLSTDPAPYDLNQVAVDADTNGNAFTFIAGSRT